MKTRLIENIPTGNYTDDFILNNKELVKNWNFATLYDKNYIKPIWNGNEYIENATTEELQEIEIKKNKETYKKIFDNVAVLTKNALERVLDKQGLNFSREQLDNLGNEYKNLYEAVKEYIENGNVKDEIIFANLLFETENDYPGNDLYELALNYNIATENLTRIQIYCKIIIFKYNYGNTIDLKYKSLIRNFRSKMITFLQKGEITKLNTGFSLFENTKNLNNQDFENKFNEFNLL